MIFATVTGLDLWILVGFFVGLCAAYLWAARSYRQILKEDAERTREREASQVAPAFDFHIARRPVASTRRGRAVRPADRVSHGGTP